MFLKLANELDTKESITAIKKNFFEFKKAVTIKWASSLRHLTEMAEPVKSSLQTGVITIAVANCISALGCDKR